MLQRSSDGLVPHIIFAPMIAPGRLGDHLGEILAPQLFGADTIEAIDHQRKAIDTVDGGQAGLHFLSLQRTIEDFVTTRKAMNQAGVQLLNPGITDTVNNGINAFIFVLRRANYIVPARGERSFPLLPDRESLLPSS